MPLKDGPKRQVVVLGAGLSGLATSRELRRVGVAHRVIERSSRPGGLACTVEEAGYRFDRTGHLLHLRDESLRSWVLEALPELHWLEIERKSVVFSHGVETKYPFQSNTFGLPPEVAFACVSDFVRAHHDPAPREVVTFEDYCRRYFGDAISDRFMVPYNQKLWGRHPRELSASWCDRFVPKPSLDDVLRGAFGLPARALGYNARFSYPRLGMGELVSALAERAGVIELDKQVLRIDAERRELVLADEIIAYERLISSIPLDRLLGLMGHEEPALVCAPLRYLDVALNTPCERTWHWAYVPDPEIPFYRVGSYSNLSPAMAPPGKGSLYVELSSRAEPDLATLLPQVADHLIAMGVIRAREAIRFARARMIEHAYVIYDQARAPALERVAPLLEAAGVSSIGRFGAWEYSSMEDALRAGLCAARAVATPEQPA